jgi:uncharacterized protein YndB with AHSA1/START domain
MDQKTITVQVTVEAELDKVWQFYTKPEHITQWNHASDNWHSPQATNDLRVGGKFSSRMEAKDGSEGFDFEGTYTEVRPNDLIAYVMPDGRKVSIKFTPQADQTLVEVAFDPETENSDELQRGGWQAILDNFKAYTEAK